MEQEILDQIGKLFAGRIGKPQDRIQGRAQPPSPNFGKDLLPGAALEAEHVPVTGPIGSAIDDDGQCDFLGVCGVVVRFLVETFGQYIDGEGHGVGREPAAYGGDTVYARRGGRRGRCELGVL